MLDDDDELNNISNIKTIIIAIYILNNDFIIRMWMKHSYTGYNEKEHIFCKSDEKRKKIFFL